MGGAKLSKSLIQFSVDGWGSAPCLLSGGNCSGNEGNGSPFRRLLLARLHSVPLPAAGHYTRSPPEAPGHARASRAQTPVGTLLLSPGSWCAQGFVCALQEPASPVLWKFCNQIPLASKIKLPRGSQSLCQIPRLGNLLWVLQLS